LVLSLVLLFGWVWPLSQRVNTLEGVALSLADQVGQNTAVCASPTLRILSPLTGSRAKVGDAVSFIGTAQHADTNRFQLAARPAAVGAAWTVIDTVSRDISLGNLALWDTTENSPATYEVRLTAVDRDNNPVANAPVCTIEIDLTD
jgi:hypothetical protein